MQIKLLIPSLFFFCCNAKAQDKNTLPFLPDSYYAAFGNDLPVYSGRLFLGYAPNIKGTPYIPEKGWTSGAVLYNNIWYRTPSLKLDIYNGNLVIQTPAQFSIIPVDYRVSRFRLGERTFLRLDSSSKSSVKPGFYEVLTDGDINVLARRSVNLDQKIENLTLESEFLRTDDFFIQGAGTFTKITSLSVLYSLLKDKKKYIKKTLKPLKLNFRKDKEALILKAVETYNQN